MTGDVSPTVPFAQPEEFVASSRFPLDWAAIAADAEGDGERFLSRPAEDDGKKDDIPKPAPHSPPAPPQTAQPAHACPRALPHGDERGCRACIVSSIQVMFASTSKHLISEIKVGFDETLNIQNAKIQSLDEKFTDQINTAVDCLSAKHVEQLEKLRTDVSDIKKASDDAKAAVTDIKKASEDAKAAAHSAQLSANQAIEKIADIKDDIMKGGSRAPSEASTEAGGAFNFSYLAAAKAQEVKAPATRAATALPPRAADLSQSLPRSSENDGYTLVVGGFDRDTLVDSMQGWLTNHLMKQIPDATDATRSPSTRRAAPRTSSSRPTTQRGAS